MAGVPPERFPAAIVSALPGPLGGSLFRGFWRRVGQEQEGVQSSPKAPRNVLQEGEKKGGGGGGEPIPGRDGRQEPLTNE